MAELATAMTPVDPPKAIWLDCDPGHDDALAILLAGHNARVQLIGISTVAGNQTVEKVTDNALAVLAATGLSGIDVVMGQHKPLMRPAPILCPEIHGDSGLDGPMGGPVLPPSTQAVLPGKAPNVMFERIAQHFETTGRKVHLVATAALTNVALLLVMYPEVAEMLEQVVIMGGCLGLGNTGPVVEFNIQTDPEAAKVVFESGVRLVMVPLEVTHTALVTTSILQRIRTHKPSPFLDLMVTLLMFFADTYRTIFRFNDPPLHDPCAAAYVIAPEMFQVEHLRVDIETCSPLSAGQTVTDIWHQSGKPKNTHVCQAMDVEKFWDLLVDAVHHADLVSPLNQAPALAAAAAAAAAPPATCP